MEAKAKVAREGPPAGRFLWSEQDEVVDGATRVAVPRQARCDSSDLSQEAEPADLVESVLEVHGQKTSVFVEWQLLVTVANMALAMRRP